jgi:DNA (cytosine-5)-methyltransferase 1
MKKNKLNIPKPSFHGFVDLFSGAGGMSFGFHKHPAFKVLAAADAEIAKLSMKAGTLRCNSTYALNMGIEPVQVDLGRIEPDQLRECLGIGDQHVSVLSACAPCTGFSRANPQNRLRNDYRNTLVEQSGLFATALDADILVMENARELLSGNFACHFQALKGHLEKHGYTVHADSHMLTRYGLPQIRERALVIAVKSHLQLKTLADLWEGCEVGSESVTVRKAFSAIRPDEGNTLMYPKFADEAVLNRLAAIPKDGGSWTDLIFHPNKDALLTGAMKRRIEKNKLGSHPDVYGRMWWDKPAPTIKRECAHIGNGRYAHPSENRLCSVREMAILQVFPNEFGFNGNSVSNNYRHIGDAVPPLISYQIAWLCQWMLGGDKPSPEQWVLPDTHLKVADLIPAQQRKLLYG